MAAFLDLCRFVASAGGTTDWTYSSAVSPYLSPTAAGATNSRTYKVRAESADLTQWEVSEGVYSSSGAGSFARTTVFYNSAGTGTLQSGAGTKINFSAAPQVWVVASKRDLLSIEEANSFSAAQKAQALQNLGLDATPVTFATPANPSGTTSATGVMMGLGASSTITPSFSGRVEISFDFSFTAASIISGVAQIRYGTGAAPANAAALQGTALGAQRAGVIAVASGQTPASSRAVVTGLTKGTAYWFDLSLSTGSGSTVSITAINCVIREI